MKKLFSQIIALTKNIHLIKPSDEDCGMENFFVGRRDPFSLGGGFGVSWWYTKKTLVLVENISFMIPKEIKEFSECDHQSVQEIIRNTFHELCVDKKLFNGDYVCFAKKNTLFDCHIENNRHYHKPTNSIF